MSASNHVFNDEFNSIVGPALIEVKCQDISLEEMGFILNGPNDLYVSPTMNLYVSILF